MPPKNPASKKSRDTSGTTLLPPDPSGRDWGSDEAETEASNQWPAGSMGPRSLQSKQDHDVYQQLTRINNLLLESRVTSDTWETINQKIDDVTVLCKENVTTTSEIARKMNDPDNGIYKRLSDAKAEATAARIEVKELETQNKQSEQKTETSFEKVEGSLTEMKTSLMKLDLNLQEIMKWRESAQNATKWAVTLVISTLFGIFVKHAWDSTVPVPNHNQLAPTQVATAQAYQTPPPSPPTAASSAPQDVRSIK